MTCAEARSLIVLLLHDELGTEEHEPVAVHLRECNACAEELAAGRRLLATLADPGPEPSEDLLERCRHDLSAALAREGRSAVTVPGWRRPGLPSGGPRLSPAFAAGLVACGFLAGWMIFGPGIAVFRKAAGRAVLGGEAEAATANVSSLVADPATDRVSLSYETLQRRSLEGSTDDPAIRRLLLATLRDSLNAGLRLDAIDALRRRSGDAEVREALLRTLREDPNAGARLKALDALQARAALDEEVRGAFLRTLTRDDNPGIRVRAIDLLAGARDPRTLAVLERLAREDPNGYVRLRSSAAPASQEARYYREGRDLVREISGAIPDAAPRIRIAADVGSVEVQAGPGAEVRYRIRARASGVDAARARRSLGELLVSASRSGGRLLFRGEAPSPTSAQGVTIEFSLTVPAATPEVEVATGAGDVAVRGVGGSATLFTRGGGIAIDRLGGALRAETRGGNIEVGTVDATARLVTAGGSVRVASAGGAVVAQTSGGDVTIGHGRGDVRAETGGGGIDIASASGDVEARSGGGNITLGAVGGKVTAATAGGSIRVVSARGGAHCETAAGPIVLRGIDGPIHAVTSSGSIRADLAPSAHPSSDSFLETWQGDVTVMVPETLPLTIRALIDDPLGSGIRSDFPLAIAREAEGAGRPLEIGEGRVGAGGPLLKIRTLGGNIAILKTGSPKR